MEISQWFRRLAGSVALTAAILAVVPSAFAQEGTDLRLPISRAAPDQATDR